MGSTDDGQAMPSVIDYDSVAEIYDLYVTADYDVPFFLTETGAREGPVVELTAGTGRLSLPLIEAGVELTCVDLSQPMLDVLAAKLERRELRADLVCADICELRLERPHSLALLPFQAFMEIVEPERQRQALAAIAASLVAGGRLICTLHNPPVRRALVDGTLRIVGRFPTADGSLLVSGFEQGGRPVVERSQLFEFFDADGRSQGRHLLPMRFTLIEHDDFEAMATAAGFRVVELYGSYDRAPFDAQRSAVMIWVLEKPAG